MLHGWRHHRLRRQQPSQRKFIALLPHGRRWPRRIGSLVPFAIGRAGGELFLLKRINRERYERIRDRFERQEFLAIMIPAMLPPPTPLKLFEFAAGVFEMKLAALSCSPSSAASSRSFWSASLVGHLVRARRWSTASEDGRSTAISASYIGLGAIAGLLGTCGLRGGAKDVRPTQGQSSCPSETA